MTDNELNELLRDLSRSSVGDVDEATERRLRVAFRARHRTNRIREYTLEFAASIAVAAGLYFLLAGGGNAHRERARSTDRYRESQFVVLPYGQSDVPLEHPVIVRVQVPEAELSRLGVSVPAIPNEAKVEADFLVGQDGIARAVRVNRRF
ncbi:MAG: hypothetical protein ACJ746_03880 [Bryobacteraceae bacterium]